MLSAATGEPSVAGRRSRAKSTHSAALGGAVCYSKNMNTHPSVGLLARNIVLIIIGGSIFFTLYNAIPSQKQEPPRFSIFEGGELSFYVIDSGGVVALNPEGNSTVRYRGMKLVSGDTPVIADSQGAAAAKLAVIRTDGTLIDLIDDGVPKYGLAARADGTAVYTAYTSSVTENGMPMGDWRLTAVSVYDTPPLATRELGSGFSPAFADDGGLIAVAPEGLVRIDPSDGNRETLVERAGMTYGIAALSPDATLAVLPNSATHVLDIFSLAPENPRLVSYLSSITAEAEAVSFLTPATFIVKTLAGFTVYTVEGGVVTAGATY